MLNTGHRRAGTVSVCVSQCANIDVKDFATFSPKVIAGIGYLHDSFGDAWSRYLSQYPLISVASVTCPELRAKRPRKKRNRNS